MRKKGVVVHVKRGRVKQTENTEIDELKSKGKMISAVLCCVERCLSVPSVSPM